MSYPTPQPEEWFWHNAKCNKPIKKTKKTRKKTNSQTKTTLKHIKKYKRLFQSIPFVSHIYLCNSTTFNANKISSDIDLVIITEPKRIRTARFYSVLYSIILNIKRTKHKHTMRFCLSFYLTNNNCNIYHLKRPHADYYLAYWIAHLIPLYINAGEDPNLILKENTRIQAHLPNYPAELSVTIEKNHTPYTKNSSIKNILQFIHYKAIGDVIEQCIKHLRIPIIRRKKKHIKKPHNIIISDHILKFHHDKRDAIYDAYHISKKAQKIKDIK